MRAEPRPVPISIGFIILNSSESYTWQWILYLL